MTKHLQGSCGWVECDLEVLWVELKQILHLTVWDRVSLPLPLDLLLLSALVV